MPNGLARFTALEPPGSEVPEGWFVLTSRRGKQFNSIVFEEEDRVQGGQARDELFLCPEDAQRLGAKQGDRLRLKNDHGEFVGTLRLSPIVAGTVQAYWPETNQLLPRRWDPISFEPDYNAPVSIERA